VPNTNIRIRKLPDHVLNAVEHMIKGGSSTYEVARFVHAQGYESDLTEKSLAKAIERYRADNAARLLPTPETVISDEMGLARLADMLPPAPPTYVERMVQEIAEDINELEIMVWLVQQQRERVIKARELEQGMPMPLELTDQAMDRLMRYVRGTMDAKQKLGILPLRPKEMHVRSAQARLNVNVGEGDLTKVLLGELVRLGVGDTPDVQQETMLDTKKRIRDGLDGDQSSEA